MNVQALFSSFQCPRLSSGAPHPCGESAAAKVAGLSQGVVGGTQAKTLEPHGDAPHENHTFNLRTNNIVLIL